MATLQNIRSKGPLLIIVVGLALFAFIAGDAWKILQPQQTQDVGEVNGESVSAQEFQKLLEEYTEAIKFSNGLTTLTDEQNNQIKDEVWNSLVNNKLIENEARKIGLTVPASEIASIIDAGVHPMLRNTPFFNQQTGMFDKDMLKKFLVDFSKMDRTNTQAQYYDYYQSMFTYWTFVERMLTQNRLAEKYHALVLKSITSNPMEAQAVFNDRVNQSDLVLASIPYSSIPDSLITVKVSEVKQLYNKRKEEFRQRTETRNIRFIDVQIVPSEEDKAALQNEMLEHTAQLEVTTSDFTGFIRSTGSLVPFLDLYVTRDALPADIIARLDSVAVGETYGPFFSAGDNTFNTFRKISKISAPDSIEFRQIQVYDADMTRTRALADSIYQAIRGGAKFEEVAALYNQPGTAVWASSAAFQTNPQMDNDNLKFVSTIMELGVNQLANVEVGVANVILQVTNRKNMVDKYKVAVVKRPNDFSPQTYDRNYNNFSSFVAANNTLDEMVANAEEAGFRVTPRADLQSNEHGIGGIRNTRDALRWVFAAKPGEVSGLYEAGENDRLLVVALESINKEGFRPLEQVQQQLRTEVVRDKKAAQIMATMKTANATTMAQYKSMENAVSDSLIQVSFSAPAYVSVLRSSEPLVGAFASIAQVDQLSQPIQGNAGVLVLQPYAKSQLEEIFDAEREKTNLENNHQRLASRFVSDLYQKARVVDNRFLFF